MNMSNQQVLIISLIALVLFGGYYVHTTYTLIYHTVHMDTDHRDNLVGREEHQQQHISNTPNCSQSKAQQPTSTEKTKEITNYSSIDWESVFSFLPPDVQRCQALFEPDVSRDFSEIFKDVPSLYATYSKEANHQRSVTDVEGSTGKFPEQVMAHRKLAKSEFIETICETGFNLGESAFNWLSSKPNTRLYSFDLGNHGYAKTMANLLSDMFPGQFTITWGDSEKTLPKFIQDHPEVKCNLIFIDGGHSYETTQADYVNFKQIAHKDNIVILDDYPDYDYLSGIWEKARHRWELAEVFRCTFGRGQVNGKDKATAHGFAVAHILDLPNTNN